MNSLDINIIKSIFKYSPIKFLHVLEKSESKTKWNWEGFFKFLKKTTSVDQHQVPLYYQDNKWKNGIINSSRNNIVGLDSTLLIKTVSGKIITNDPNIAKNAKRHFSFVKKISGSKKYAKKWILPFKEKVIDIKIWCDNIIILTETGRVWELEYVLGYSNCNGISCQYCGKWKETKFETRVKQLFSSQYFVVVILKNGKILIKQILPDSLFKIINDNLYKWVEYNYLHNVDKIFVGDTSSIIKKMVNCFFMDGTIIIFLMNPKNLKIIVYIIKE